METWEIGEAIVSALDAGMSQRDVASELGRSQSWVSVMARWWVREQGRPADISVTTRAVSLVTNTHKRPAREVVWHEGPGCR